MIAFLMGLSAFGGMWFAVKYRGKSDVRLVNWASGDDEVERAIKEGATPIPKVFNLEDLPSAEMAYSRKSFAEELHRGRKQG